MAMLQEGQKTMAVPVPAEREKKSRRHATKSTPFKQASMSVTALLAMGGLKSKQNNGHADHGKDENKKQKKEKKDNDKKDRKDNKSKKEKKNKKDKKGKKEKDGNDGKHKGKDHRKKRKEQSDSDVEMSDEQIAEVFKGEDEPMYISKSSTMEEPEQQKKRKLDDLDDAASKAEHFALQDAKMLMMPNGEEDEDIEGDDLHSAAATLILDWIVLFFVGFMHGQVLVALCTILLSHV